MKIRKCELMLVKFLLLLLRVCVWAASLLDFAIHFARLLRCGNFPRNTRKLSGHDELLHTYRSHIQSPGMHLAVTNMHICVWVALVLDFEKHSHDCFACGNFPRNTKSCQDTTSCCTFDVAHAVPWRTPLGEQSVRLCVGGVVARFCKAFA